MNCWITTGVGPTRHISPWVDQWEAQTHQQHSFECYCLTFTNSKGTRCEDRHWSVRPSFSLLLPFCYMLPGETKTYFQKFANHDFMAWLCTNTYSSVAKTQPQQTGFLKDLLRAICSPEVTKFRYQLNNIKNSTNVLWKQVHHLTWTPRAMKMLQTKPSSPKQVRTSLLTSVIARRNNPFQVVVCYMFEELRLAAVRFMSLTLNSSGKQELVGVGDLLSVLLMGFSFSQWQTAATDNGACKTNGMAPLCIMLTSFLVFPVLLMAFNSCQQSHLYELKKRHTTHCGNRQSDNTGPQPCCQSNRHVVTRTSPGRKLLSSTTANGAFLDGSWESQKGQLSCSLLHHY